MNMSKIIEKMANNLVDNRDELKEMSDYIKITLFDGPVERKNRNKTKREIHFKYKERNRRKKVS